MVALEREMHERFKRCRGVGEWFALSDEEVDWIRAYTERLD
jgi:hypothetical protein